jgi:hypothetical protein
VKRHALVATMLVGAAATTTAAYATSNADFSGKVSNPKCGTDPALTCGLSFVGKTANGKVKKVTRLTWRGIPIHCKEGLFKAHSQGPPPPPMKVNAHRKFKGNVVFNHHRKLNVTGKFSSDYKSATGTFRFHGDFSPTGTNCDTGIDHYHVKR